jgi:cytochrome c peroxidase
MNRPGRGPALACLALLACSNQPDSSQPGFALEVPEGFPNPKIPDDNPLTESKVELGRRLFYDTRLSGNGTQSCASCHKQELAFTDGLALSRGSTGDQTARGSMSLTNVAYVPYLTWANDRLTSLELQAMVPMFNEVPTELGLSGMEEQLVARLAAVPRYVELFRAAFPDQELPISVPNIVRAIAAFERTLLSGDSPYDRAIYRGEADALGASERRGMELFFGERLDCFHCHGGFDFSDSVAHTGQVIAESNFHNNALYNVDGRGGYPAAARGLIDVTGDPRDMGLFRAPTLRNIELTAPYMHDGSLATLDDVLDHYAAGGRTVAEGPNAGVGSESPLKSPFMHGFTLTQSERADVLAFLRSLTDTTFTHDPRFGPPSD